MGNSTSAISLLYPILIFHFIYAYPDSQSEAVNNVRSQQAVSQILACPQFIKLLSLDVNKINTLESGKQGKYGTLFSLFSYGFTLICNLFLKNHGRI